MIVNIKNKEYQLSFGIAFIRALDAKYFTPGVGGAKFGLGVEVSVPKLLTGDVVALADMIYEATASEKNRPTQKDVDSYIDGVEDVEALFDEVIEELKKSNATKKKTTALLESLNETKTGA